MSETTIPELTIFEAATKEALVDDFREFELVNAGSFDVKSISLATMWNPETKQMVYSLAVIST